jgi:ABC-type glutathione transport system ATPase component
VAEIADQVVVMRNGLIVEKGSAKQVLHEPCTRTRRAYRCHPTSHAPPFPVDLVSADPRGAQRLKNLSNGRSPGAEPACDRSLA